MEAKKMEVITDTKQERTRCEVYSRVVGYLRPVDQWNEGKQAEFAERQEYVVKPATIQANTTEQTVATIEAVV